MCECAQSRGAQRCCQWGSIQPVLFRLDYLVNMAHRQHLVQRIPCSSQERYSSVPVGGYMRNENIVLLAVPRATPCTAPFDEAHGFSVLRKSNPKRRQARVAPQPGACCQSEDPGLACDPDEAVNAFVSASKDDAVGVMTGTSQPSEGLLNCAQMVPVEGLGLAGQEGHEGADALPDRSIG